MAVQETYFNFEPASNKVPCGGLGIVGGGIIGKNFYDGNAIDDIRFSAFVDEKDIHTIPAGSSAQENATSDRVWSNKIKLIPQIQPLLLKKTLEYLIANPHAADDDISIEFAAATSLAKSYTSKDLLNLYCPTKYGVECVGGIEDNEENQADGHLAFAKIMNSNVTSIISKINRVINTSALIGMKETAIEQINLYPYNMPSEEQIVSGLDKIANGLYFYLDGALLVADAPTESE